VIVTTDGDTFARQVAAAYAAETKSIVTFVGVTLLDAHGGPFHKHAFSETAYEETDGTPVRKRVLRSVDDGRTADPGDLVKQSQIPDAPSSRFGMKLPVLPSAVDDYTFDRPRDDGTTISVAFTAKIRDAAHGDGSLTFLRNENRLATIVIRPAVLPEHATSMTTTLEFGKVSDDRWDVVKVTHAFTGREGIISGGGVSVTTYERYRPYTSAPAADAALDAMQPESG
jgi:hypothetical protein